MAEQIFTEQIRDTAVYQYVTRPESRQILPFHGVDVLYRFINNLDQEVRITIEATDDIDGEAFADAVTVLAETPIAAGGIHEEAVSTPHEVIRITATVDNALTAPTAGEVIGRKITRQ